MLALTIKEIRGFFSSITGYLVIVVFLLLNSLFLWIFDGGFNILNSGYASIDSLFLIAPWVFLFLIPAITMRLFSEEFRLGTITLLLTRPISEMNIILGKFLAGFILVLLALVPTLLYYYTVYALGDPMGNVDSGGTFGSYIGLLFLGASYVAIGLFSSSLSQNPIISFLTALCLCFFFFYGFDQLAAIIPIKGAEFFIANLGINEHYTAMSRGVIDSRDLVYFISLIIFFTLTTKLVLRSRKW